MSLNTPSRWLQLTRYVVTGTLTTLLDLLVFQVCFYQFGFSRNESVFFAFVLALVFSFIVNRFWTFQSNYDESEWRISQFLKFVFVASIGLAIMLFCMKIATEVFLIEPLWAKLLSSGVVFVWNFVVNSFWTFNDSRDEEIIKPLLPENKNFPFEISVVIPAFNEESRLPDTIKKAIEYFSSLGIPFEIIVVDDGSSDRTAQMAEFLLQKTGRVIVLEKNRGKGFAVKTGVLSAKGRYVLFCDADGATPFSEYSQLREAMLFSQIAIGSRYKNRKSVKQAQPLYRVFLSRLVNFVAQIFLIEGISDTQCGFKLFRNDVGKQIFALQNIERFAFDIEFLMLAKQFGYRIVEVPVLWFDQPGTKVEGMKDGIRALKDFFRIKFYMMFGLYSKETR